MLAKAEQTKIARLLFGSRRRRGVHAGVRVVRGGAYRDALELFGRSIEATGESADSWLNRALCHERCSVSGIKPVECVYRALASDPQLVAPDALLERLRG
jgi:hypothetical protein